MRSRSRSNKKMRGRSRSNKKMRSRRFEAASAPQHWFLSLSLRSLVPHCVYSCLKLKYILQFHKIVPVVPLYSFLFPSFCIFYCLSFFLVSLTTYSRTGSLYTVHRYGLLVPVCFIWPVVQYHRPETMIPESIDADPDPKDPNIFAGSGSEFVGFGSIEPDKNLSRWRIGNVTCGWPSPISHTIQIKHTF